MRAEKARRSLKEFIVQAWPVLEPDSPFCDNWHIDAICQHLEAVTSGQIRNLIINVPPGHMKSLTVCVFWPAWAWIKQPHLRFLFASYAADLSARDSNKTRKLISSEWYQANFGASFGIDKWTESLIVNSKLGFRMASSTGGVGTGERVHFSINDDLLRANDAHSAAERAKAIGHMRAMSTRGVEPSTYGQVLIMQRLHNDDPAGWALKESGKKWEHLRLPAEYDAGRPCRTSIGWEDPRRNDGDLLWPERFSAEELAAQKVALGGYGYAAQFQQSPAPAGGGIFKLEWLEQCRYDARPESGRIIQSWDTASKSGELNDPSVCTTWLEHEGRLYLIDVLRKRMEYPELKRAVQSSYELHRPVSVLIEDKSSGQALIQELRAKLPIISITPTQDKVSRAAHVSPMVEAGRVWLPNSAPWLFDFEQELAGFPLTTHDDQVDSVSQFLNWYHSRGSNKGPVVAGRRVIS